jgi:hypothetical protein
MLRSQGFDVLKVWMAWAVCIGQVLIKGSSMRTPDPRPQIKISGLLCQPRIDCRCHLKINAPRHAIVTGKLQGDDERAATLAAYR